MHDRSGWTAVKAAGILTVLFAVGACSDSVGPEASGVQSLAKGGVINASLTYVDGNGQTAMEGTRLPIPAVVRVVDQRGAPVPNVPVTFVVVAGGGSTLASGDHTDSNGVVSAIWTLGSGQQRMEARASRPAWVKSLKISVVAFTATATENTQTVQPVATVTLSPIADTVAVGGTRGFQAALRDAAGNLLSHRPVSWSSGDLAVARVSSDGTVTGLGSGAAVIQASSEGVAGSAAVYVVAAALGSLEIIAPRDTIWDVGDTMTVRTVTRDASGTLVEGGTVTWAALNPDIATVNAMGRITARAAGIALITVSAICCSSDTSSFVVDPPATAPAAVTDLAAAAATTSEVTLRWTAVSDGNGGVAKYVVRYGSPTLTWNSAYSTERVVQANTVGQEVTYTYPGLEDDTGYQFRLVTYRGTLNQDAVFGPASNLAAAQTEPAEGTPPADNVVTSVVVSPSTHTFTATGQTLQASATARNAGGAVVSGTSLSWTSSNSSIVSVSNMGVMTANAAGTALIIVTAVCCGPSDTLQVTVNTGSTPPPPSSGTALFEDDFEGYSNGQEVTGGSGGFNWGGGNGDGVFASSTRAHSGSRSMLFRFAPSGHVWAEQRFNIGRVLPEVWIEYWIHVPDNYYHRSVSPANNKFFFLWDSGAYPGGNAGQVSAMLSVERPSNGDSDIRMMWSNQTTGMTISGAPSWSNALTDAVRGRWSRVRIHVKTATSSSARDGVFRFWWDDALRINQTQLPLYDTGDNGFQRGYLMGYDNSGYNEQTDFYIDDFKVYSTNPGW